MREGKTGGVERNESGADEIANNDAEDEDSEEEDEDEETGRKRKRGKLASPGATKKDKKSPVLPQSTTENATTSDSPAQRK